jgi:hypothetical protein
MDKWTSAQLAGISPVYVVQGDDYAAEVYRSEGEGHRYKVIVHDREWKRAMAVDYVQVPEQAFESLRQAKDFADFAIKMAWARETRLEWQNKGN